MHIAIQLQGQIPVESGVQIAKHCAADLRSPANAIEMFKRPIS
jgi:hypothetical protein